MESQSNSFSNAGNNCSLFPAYSSSSQEKVDIKNDKDWLCNSSYTPDSFQNIFNNQKELPKQEESTLEDIKDKKKKHKKHKKEHTKKHIIQPVVSPAESPSIRSQLNKKTFIEETGLSFERAYRIDSKCDRENIYYDSFEGKKIAKYKIHLRTFFGSTAQEQNYFQASSSKPKESAPRYFSKKALKLLAKSTSEVEVSSFKGDIPSINLEFIPLSSSSKVTDVPVTVDLKSNFDGVSTSWKTSSVKKDVVEDMETADVPCDDELRNKTIAFNKQVAESPQNIQLWMDFVRFQEELYRSNKEGFTETYLIEKKVAILDKALKHNPKSVQLNIAKLDLCRSIWKIEKVIEHWDNLIFINPNDPNVWQEYVTFVLTDITYFSMSRILKVFSKCLKTLSNLSEGIIQSHVAPPDIVFIMLDVFSQLCFVLKSCGYTEKAVAAYQSLIEFNLFDDPFTKSLSVAEKITCFEPFWDSGASRFGEDGAIGWSATVLQKKVSFEKTVFQSDLSNMEDDILYQKLPEWKTWLEFEKLREVHHWLPWKPNPEYDQTDDDIDDIDRTVPFEDISKFMFSISDNEAKFLLVHSFVKFLGFNPHAFGCHISTESKTNTRLDIYNFDVISGTLNDTLFGSQTFSPLCFKSHVWTIERVNFIKNIFSQTLGMFPLEYKVLVSYMWLKFLQIIGLDSNIENENIEGAKKFAKNMLKETGNRNCLLLWCEYIKMESSSTSNTKAKKTFETLLASSSLAIACGSMKVKELWYFIRSYIDFCMSSTDCQIFSKNEIIWLLVHIGCKEKYVPYKNEEIKPTLILKAVTGFKSFLIEEINLASTSSTKLCYCLDPYRYSLLDCIKCFAYLQYFTQGLDSAVLILKDTSKVLEDKITGELKSNLLEQICIFQAELLSYHTKNNTVSMKPLLTYLYNSIEEFTDSTQLLHTLLKWRSASSVVSPTRRFFAKILKQNYNTQPITWIFAIASELAISHLIFEQNSINNIENDLCLGLKWKIRALYERALNSLCSHIPVLWRSYLKFEMQNNDVEKARSVFHRAMQNCGWSKDLLMDGVEFFSDDLKQILDFMMEKQIRVHTPLEEITLLMEHGIQNL